MCAVVRKIISGKELRCKEVITINAILPNDKYVLLKGIVYSPDGKPLPNSAIEIIQINKNINPEVRKSIGVTFSLENGSYGVPLLWGKGYFYKLIAYSPI
ncbi:hypothetical protein [Clostridium sp.]|uniref:hypothetical protein n=1 Tax=Clostridium sp. TaxID=1506 RepID=UPI002841683D|nr:hypothetical protein [Clostridium sp.]MDR3594081.1 hypothetical protein [Clostridium sp.]